MQKNIVIGKGSHYQCFDKSTAFLWLQEGFFVEGKEEGVEVGRREAENVRSTIQR